LILRSILIGMQMLDGQAIVRCEDQSTSSVICSDAFIMPEWNGSKKHMYTAPIYRLHALD